jgi:hypothetical protein
MMGGLPTDAERQQAWKNGRFLDAARGLLTDFDPAVSAPVLGAIRPRETIPEINGRRFIGLRLTDEGSVPSFAEAECKTSFDRLWGRVDLFGWPTRDGAADSA